MTVGTICERCSPYTSQQVRQCIAMLAQHQLVKMVDMIKLSNCYSVRDEIFNFFKEEVKVKAAASYIFVNEVDSLDMLDRMETDLRMIPAAILQALFSGFRKDISLEEYIV